MSELKITIDQLKNYLGTGLKCQSSNDAEYRRNKDIPVEFEMYGLTDGYAMIDCSVLQTDCEYEDLKPICYRLSDLDKFIPELGFVPFKRLLNNEPEKDDSIEIEFIEGRMPFQKRFRAFAWVDYPDGESRKEHLSDFFLNGNHGMVPFSWMQQLFQWHFWTFGDEYFEAGLVIDKFKL